ncbi:MAG TPA: class I SAM-dependent methyltransferase [Candidatus Cybelea sp.]|nr:class I SAM-dependent methyltransferase [Candidatus Cybelea sp.]
MSFWDSLQDEQITERVETIRRFDNDQSPVMRVFANCDDVIADRHFTNLMAVFRQSDTFSILDVGSGLGRFLGRVALHFDNAELHGIDTNEPSLEISRALVPRAHLANASFNETKGQFDFVVCSQVFEHVEDTHALLDALVRLTKPGGYISISTVSGWTYWRPRLGNLYHALTNWNFYKRVRLFPEKNWQMALPHHPAILPSKLIKMFRSRRGDIVCRSSTMWLARIGGPIHRLCNWSAGPRGATKIRAAMLFLDAAMEVIPGFRIFESVFVLLVRNPL